MPKPSDSNVNAAARVFGSWQHLPGEPQARWFGWSEIVVTQVVKKAGRKRHRISRIVAQGCVYNFCTPHTSLALELASLRQRRRG